MRLPSAHLSIAVLVDIAEGRVAPSTEARARAHLLSCSQCAREVAELERVIGLMRTDAGEDAPAPLVERAVGLFRRHPAPVPEEPSLVRRVLAMLSFDSGAMRPAFGMRAGPAAARQLLYSAGELDIDVRLQPAGTAWTVGGQMLGPCDGGRVELSGAGATVEAALNDLCEWTLPPVPPGTYSLVIRSGGSEIVVDELTVGV